MKIVKYSLLMMLLGVSLALSSCGKQDRTVGGAAIGAVSGAAIGAAASGGDAGAIIGGAAIGGVLGGIIGHESGK